MRDVKYSHGGTLCSPAPVVVTNFGLQRGPSPLVVYAATAIE